MAYQLEFEISHKYLSSRGGIWIPALLQVGEQQVKCDAKIDTGADYCVFRREVAESLELEVEAGYRTMLSSGAGSVETYQHEVTLSTLGLSFQSFVCFASHYEFPRNLLGCAGWLNLLKLGIVDYEEMIYLSPYAQSQL
jgi:predicted aspartyl protease